MDILPGIVHSMIAMTLCMIVPHGYRWMDIGSSERFCNPLTPYELPFLFISCSLYKVNSLSYES